MQIDLFQDTIVIQSKSTFIPHIEMFVSGSFCKGLDRIKGNSNS